ncbi:cupin domain-containing protein [Xanthocytophaga agilis]|uniref:Cupin domain-containing protein n=1 Tax=Xanthocytophaga agilis TaxID=3048010 RepID=A0AAE3UIT3_9BACT|nr:cupin domain-containing protein [Xanthocytophaga agilis]MDJ1505771.1 cupin domain-containing protein [Xanthocytophaga agilis]
METFEKLIAPVTVEDFAANYWRKTPLFISKPSEFADQIVNVNQINDYLSAPAIAYPFVRMVGNGAELDIKKYQLANQTSQFNFLNKTKVFELFEQGNTIVIQAAQFHFTNLNRFIYQLEKELRMEVHANIYITPAGSRGFDPHLDAHEVMVIQLYGSKEWNIYDLPIPAPLKGQKLTPEQKQAYLTRQADHQITLQEGDILYVPRGVVHDAFTQKEPSIHITLGFHPILRTDIVQQLIQKVESIAYFREPFFDFNQTNGSAVNKEELIAQMATALREMLTTRSEENYTDSKFADTKDMFNHLLLLDSVQTQTDLNHFQIHPLGKDIPSSVRKGEEEDFMRRLLDNPSTDLPVLFEDIPLESFKYLSKRLANKSLIQITTK